MKPSLSYWPTILDYVRYYFPPHLKNIPSLFPLEESHCQPFTTLLANTVTHTLRVYVQDIIFSMVTFV